MEHELLEHGRKLIDEMRREVIRLVEDGYDQGHAEDGVFDDYIGNNCNNYDLAAVLWASGFLDDALREVYEDVTTYIFDPVRE